jgi:cysteine desulfurase
MHRIYMDANATTPLDPEVFAAMRPYMLESFGNASSIHYHGQHARAAVEHARESVAAMLHCRPAEIVFTSGGTEGDNLAIFGLIQPGDHLITSAIEHHAVLHAAERLAERGIEVTFLPVDSNCLIDPGDLRRALKPNTKLISIMMANNETGSIQPVEEIGKIAAEADVYFHTDAVQAAGKLPIDVKQIGCDLLAIAGHKMYAPQGVGALYVRRGTQLEPLFFGGAHERQRRAGTENVAGIVGLGKAAELAKAAVSGQEKNCHPERSREAAQSKDLQFASNSTNVSSNGSEQTRVPHPSALSAEGWEEQNSGLPRPEGTPDLTRIQHLRNKLEQGLLNRRPNTGVNAGQAPRVPNTTNLYFDHLEGEALVIALDLKGLAVSGGSACASGATEPSHVLTAMGLSPERARASLRFSLTRYTTEEEIDRALEIVAAAVTRLREISPVYAGTLG